MEIYIQNGQGQWIGQRFEILSSNTPTKDETLETFSFALISNNVPNPIAPMQKVRVYFAVSEYTDFYVVSDSVETYSLKPLRYKHNISCIQNTRALSKHVVRNSVFSQPAYKYKKSYNATSEGAQKQGRNGGSSAWWNEYINDTSNLPHNERSAPLVLEPKEKIKKATFTLHFQFGYGEHQISSANYCDTAHSASDILNLAYEMDTITIANNLTLRYKNANNQTITETITPSTFGLTSFDLNGTYDFPRIKELADQGCNNFELLFNTLYFMDGTYTAIGNDDLTKIRVLFWFAQLEIKAETYYWTCYDVLNLLIERQKKETSLNSLTPLFSLPQSGDLYDLLKNTVAPNFTFTQLTMYECVAEVFRLFDAIFTMDENGVLGIEYFNDLSGDYLTTKQKRFTGRTLALGEDKYTNGLVANYQDARIEEAFPRLDGKFAPLRSVDFGIADAGDHNLIVPHNIDTIVKCEVFLKGINVKFNDAIDNPWTVVTNASLDITDFIFEETIWSTLDKGDLTDSDYDTYNIKQPNSLFFQRGDNKIQVAVTFKDRWNLPNYALENIVKMAILKLAGVYTYTPINQPQDVFYPTPNPYHGDWADIRMRLVYVATVDGKTKTHSLTNKYDGETLIDQSNGAVDLNKMGLNMLGLSLKLGNPTLNATHRISSWADRIRVGQLYEYDGALWVANVVNYTFINGYVQGKVSFVQNFNALALRTQLLREKRMSNISKELVQKSEEILTDFVYFSTESINENGNQIHFNKDYLKAFIRDSFNISGPYSMMGDSVLYWPDLDNGIYGVGVYIPMVRYGAGNAINFEMSFEHPMNAGNVTQVTTNWAGVNKYYTQHAIYTDNYGFMDKASIKTPVYSDKYYGNEFPLVFLYSTSDAQGRSVGYFDIQELKVYKQPNEIFALNYQLAFLPIPGRENIDFIGNEWINNNCFVKDFEEENRKLYFVAKEEKSSNLDVKAIPYFAKKTIHTVTLNSGVDHKFSLSLGFNALTTSELNEVESWAIVDDRDNVLFASNKKPTSNNSINIYFITKPNRLT